MSCKEVSGLRKMTAHDTSWDIFVKKTPNGEYYDKNRICLYWERFAGIQRQKCNTTGRN